MIANKFIGCVICLCMHGYLLAQVTATVDFSRSEGKPLEKIFGGYTSEKETNENSGVYVSDIYDPGNTLGPLNGKYHRMQLKADELGGKNPWIDADYHWQDSPSGCQEQIIKFVQEMGMINQVSVNTPQDVQRNAERITAWYTSIANTLVEFSEGIEIWLHFFGEPELWAWYTGYNTFDDFWWEFEIAYTAVAAVRELNPNLKIAGCGFAFGGLGIHTGGIYWYREFINRLIENGYSMDAITYHHFFEWDDTHLINTDQVAAVARFDHAKEDFDRYKNSSAATGHDVKLHINEFNWVFGDWNTTFEKSRSYLSYRNTARAFESMFYSGIESFTGVDKIFWAQSVGEAFLDMDFWTFLPFVNWVEKSYYTYNAAYYSFWFYGKMPVSRRQLIFTDETFRGFASSDSISHFLVVWNRTDTIRNINFNIIGLAHETDEYYCKISEVNSSNYNKLNQFPPSATIKLEALDTFALDPESTIMLEIWSRSDVPTHTVTFNVEDINGSSIENAAVTIGTETKTTDENGIAVFYSVDGTYLCKVVKDGYINHEFNLTVKENDISIDVQMKTEVTYTKIPSDIELSVFPNPSRDTFTVEASEVIKQIRLIDTNGKVIKVIAVDNFEAKISINAIRSGVYLMQIYTGERIITKRVQVF